MSSLFTSKTPSLYKAKTLVVDCGATHHMFNNKELFLNFVETEKFHISTSNPTSNLVSTGSGTAVIEIENKALKLLNCLYVPNPSKNLVSLIELFLRSITIIKQDNSFSIVNNNKLILRGQIINNLMISNFNKLTTLFTTANNLPCWHSRLGHPSNQWVF
ncbi:hypothetical protein O181_026927 [Austropuccinia psidii MF-1]|uniref:Retrovirus-related Pol polyprotein from transposon TNT 1-94-like beta-barrel domain-containing protein n=1 Tax=Austropuccinia psidii MF-1 TaxID=1389203 RepID=A0A9Q3H178_9BASI|nr:hypothetical protein [Austropuccinia psidii MF-1]